MFGVLHLNKFRYFEVATIEKLDYLNLNAFLVGEREYLLVNNIAYLSFWEDYLNLIQ